MATAMEVRTALTIVLNESLTNVPEELLREVERAHMTLEDDKVLQDLDEQVDTLWGEVAVAEAREGFHNNRANALETTVADQGGEINRLNELNRTLNDMVDNQREMVNGLERRVAAHDERIWLRDEWIETLDAVIKAKDDEIAQLRKLVETLNATVETMDVGKGALERIVAALETRIRLRDHTIAEGSAHFTRLLDTLRIKDDLINRGFQELEAMADEIDQLKGEVEQQDGYITDCLNLLAEKRRTIMRLTKDSRAAARRTRRIMQVRFHKYQAMKARKGRVFLIKLNMKRAGLA